MNLDPTVQLNLKILVFLSAQGGEATFDALQTEICAPMFAPGIPLPQPVGASKTPEELTDHLETMRAAKLVEISMTRGVDGEELVESVGVTEHGRRYRTRIEFQPYREGSVEHSEARRLAAEALMRAHHPELMAVMEKRSGVYDMRDHPMMKQTSTPSLHHFTSDQRRAVTHAMELRTQIKNEVERSRSKWSHPAFLVALLGTQLVLLGFLVWQLVLQ